MPSPNNDPVMTPSPGRYADYVVVTLRLSQDLAEMLRSPGGLTHHGAVTVFLKGYPGDEESILLHNDGEAS